MLTNKDMILELLATYSDLLQKEIDYLEKNENNNTFNSLLVDLRLLLIDLCAKVYDIYSTIGLDKTNILINSAKARCRQLFEKNGSFQHKITGLPNTYADISSQIISALKHLEEIHKNEYEILMEEVGKQTSERLAMLRR